MDKRSFKFYMTTNDPDEEFTGAWTVDDNYPEVQEELDYLLDQFKRFLLMCGYCEDSISHLRYLEDDEWKYVLTQYGEWNSEHEKIYEARKGLDKIK